MGFFLLLPYKDITRKILFYKGNYYSEKNIQWFLVLIANTTL